MSEAMEANDQAVFLTVDVMTAALSRQEIGVDKISDLIIEVHQAISFLLDSTPLSGPVEPQKPAVPIKKSVTPDYIVCLECGKKLKSLKRHIEAAHGLNLSDYRTKWELPPDYPRMAPNSSAIRSEWARKFGLGRMTKRIDRSGE